MKYKSAIIDDETLNIDLLKELIRSYCPEIEIVATAMNVDDGIKAVIEYRPQILFLDIELQDRTGFDILKAVDDYELQVILVSAHDKYAFKAFKYAVIDYILKPVSVEELIAAVKRCKARIQKIGTHEVTKIGRSKDAEFLSVPHKDFIELIRITDIIHLDSAGGCTEIFTIQNKKLVTSKRLKDIEDQLPKSYFLRIHHSHVINMHYIVKYVRGKFGSLLLVNNTEVPISLTYKKVVVDRLGL